MENQVTVYSVDKHLWLCHLWPGSNLVYMNVHEELSPMKYMEASAI